MHCLFCNAEIKDHDQKQCPQCNSLLLEDTEPEILPNGLQAGEQSEQTETGSKSKSENGDSDEFDLFLEDITSEIDRLVASDNENAAERNSQIQTADDDPSAAAADRELEQTGKIDQVRETKDINTSIDDLEPLIREFDELIEEELGSELEAAAEDESQVPETDVVIELTDVIEHADVIELTDVIEPAEQRENERLTQSSDEIIELFEIIEPVDDEEEIEEISELDFVTIEPFAVETPAKPKRSLKTAGIIAGTAVVLIAAVLGGTLYFKAKPSAIIASRPSSTMIVKKKAPKTFVPPKPRLDKNVGLAGKNTDEQKVKAAKTEIILNKTKSAVVSSKPGDKNKEVKTDTSITPAGVTAPYFTIQVAALKNSYAAQAILAILRDRGYDAYVFEKANAKGLVRYKLRIGKYKTKAEAKKAAKSYYDAEQKPFIIVQSKAAQ